MRILEVRRHSMRNKPNEHLSNEGIALAQSVGSESGPFDLVVTSPIQRAVETAVAMGFVVSETWQVLSELSSSVYHNSGWPASLDQLRRLANQHHNVGSFAKTQAHAWRDVVIKINDGEQVLIVFYRAGRNSQFTICQSHRMERSYWLLRRFSFYIRG